jgi:hypothetical protein
VGTFLPAGGTPGPVTLNLPRIDHSQRQIFEMLRVPCRQRRPVRKHNPGNHRVAHFGRPAFTLPPDEFWYRPGYDRPQTRPVCQPCIRRYGISPTTEESGDALLSRADGLRRQRCREPETYRGLGSFGFRQSPSDKARFGDCNRTQHEAVLGVVRGRRILGQNISACNMRDWKNT